MIREGIRFSIDEERRVNGQLVMTLVVPDAITGMGNLDIEAIFPDAYPHFRPQIFAPRLELVHHQDPFGGNLCLVARGSRLWSEADTLGWLIGEQLPKMLASSNSPDPNQGEPASSYLSYAPGSVVLVDSNNLPPDHVTSGTLVLRLPRVPPIGDFEAPWMAAVSSFKWETGSVLGSRAVQSVQPEQTEEAVIPWARISDVTSANSVEELWESTIRQLGGEAAVGPGVEVSSAARAQYLLVIFPEEHGPDEIGTGLAALIHVYDPRNRAARRASDIGTYPALNAYLRVARVGESDLRSRAPDLSGASQGHVLLVGCGALGSVIADHLARSGIRKLTVVDGDVLEPGNLIRHAASMREVGLKKADATAKIAVAANPALEVNVINGSIGGPRAQSIIPEESIERQVWAAVTEANLVIDATAELAVHELLADMARSDATDFIFAEVTGGAWSGYVGCFGSDGEGCWNCAELGTQDGSLVLPNGDSNGTIQPVGCAEPTFTGASVDLGEVALQTVRVALEALSGGSRLCAVIDSVELRGADGHRHLPAWKRQIVPRHSSCSWH